MSSDLESSAGSICAKRFLNSDRMLSSPEHRSSPACPRDLTSVSPYDLVAPMTVQKMIRRDHSCAIN